VTEPPSFESFDTAVATFTMLSCSDATIR